MTRNITLDIARTVAIVLMVIFHFIYDLKFFAYITWDTPDGPGWRHFRWLIISLFFLCLGVSLTFTHRDVFKNNKFFVRLSQISLAALLISVITYSVIPQNWIFFGVLHFLALASCLVVWFVKLPKTSGIIGMICLLIGVLELLPSRWPFDLLSNSLPQYTNDYVAIFPWLGMVFIGVYIAHSKWFNADPLKPLIQEHSGRSLLYLTWPGQHSLRIYLLHQPIMMGFLYLSTRL